MFWFQIGLLYRRGCIYFLEGQSRLPILKLCHNLPDAGCFGQFKTWNLVSRCFWWLDLWAFIKDYITSCNLCTSTKNPWSKPLGLLQRLLMPPQPWSINELHCRIATLSGTLSNPGCHRPPYKDGTLHLVLYCSYCMGDGSALPGKCLLLPGSRQSWYWPHQILQNINFHF